MVEWFNRLDASVKWITEAYGAAVMTLGAIFMLYSHLFSRVRDSTILVSIILVLSILAFIDLAVEQEPVSLGLTVAFLLIYAAVLFIILSVTLQSWLALTLTKARGEQWVKELDYIYLSIGSIGVFASVNRLPFITGKIEFGDLMAPFLLTTAIVIRFIKTRAEIGGWNKLSFSSGAENHTRSEGDKIN